MRLRGTSKALNAVAFSPDGTQIIHRQRRWHSKLWKAAPGQDEIVMYETVPGTTPVLLSSPNGRRCLSAAPARASQTDRQGVRWIAVQADGLTQALFFPDGDRAAGIRSDGSTGIWNTHDGKSWCRLLRTRAGDRLRTPRSRYPPDGSRIAIGSSDTTASIRDAATGALALRLVGHTEAVESVAFSPDGRTIANG